MVYNIPMPVIPFIILAAVIGLLAGIIIGISWFPRPRGRYLKDGEMEYIPMQERVNKMKSSKPIFAEPVEPEDAFKKAKDVDDFISKIK